MSEIPTDEYPELVEIMKGAWHFLLYESGTRYFLSVLCGSSAAFNLDIELTSEEIDAYQQHGKEFIEWLAKIIFDNITQ